MSSGKQNNWKVDNFTKKTLRYLVDLCLYCATDYSPKGINDFFKDMFENCEDFDAILEEVYTSYSTNLNKNNPEFLTPPLYIEEMVFDENLNTFKATRVSSLDTLFTILRNDKHILHLRSYTGERPGELTANRENREIDVDDLTQSSSTPTNLVLLEDRPAQIPSEDIIKLTEFVSNQNPELAIFLKEIGGKGFSDLLDDFFDGRLSFLTEDVSFSSQLANLSLEFEQLKTKRKEIVCTPLVYGFTIFSILPKIIELSQNIVTSFKNKIKYSENTWIEDPEVLSKLVKALSPQVNSILKKINTDEESLRVFDQVLAGFDVTKDKLFTPGSRQILDLKQPKGFAKKTGSEKSNDMTDSLDCQPLLLYFDRLTNLEIMEESFKVAIICNIRRVMTDLKIFSYDIFKKAIYGDNDIKKTDFSIDLMELLIQISPVELDKAYKKNLDLFNSDILLAKLGLFETIDE